MPALKRLFESSVRLYFVPRRTFLLANREETTRFTLCIHREHPWNISVEQILAYQCQVMCVPRALCGTLNAMARDQVSG